MNKDDICYMPAWQMAEKIKSQEFSSIEITEVFIERIKKINPIINAYCTTTFDLARIMAKKADLAVKKGEKLGILNGIPTSIKDTFSTKGIRTTFGSKLFENYIPKEDSVCVSRLKDAGIVMLGKTNTPEFGFKGVTDNFIFGATKNPWDLNRTPGGSSGGAAAGQASGLSFLALGSDGGGSIRVPCSFCGLYGLKPSFGRIADYPSNRMMGTTLRHLGPIVRNVKDAALMLDAMKGPYEGDRYSLPKEDFNYIDVVEERPKKLKIGYSLNLGILPEIDPEVENAVLSSIDRFQEFDWSVEEAKVKRKNIELAFITFWDSFASHFLKPKLAKWGDKLDPALVETVEAGLDLSAYDFIRAMNIRKRFYEVIHQLFKKYDILITPTSICPAFELNKSFPDKIGNWVVPITKWCTLTYAFNLTGNPAASIPCGWSNDGLPIGMQIVGPRFDEKTVIQVSKAFEDIAPWQDKKPKFS